MMNDKFCKEWISRAEKEDANSVYQFMCYYIVINHLYDSLQGRNELDRFITYIQSVVHSCNYSPFSVLAEDSEILKGVKSERRNRSTNKTKLSNGDIDELVTSIYYVRCNLFHGSKSMDSPRSQGLIADCCKVLRSLFEMINIQ